MDLRISSGFLKGRRFKVPLTDLRPTGEKVRSAFFNSLFSMIEFENRTFLDIFSGSGAFAFESISRGFVKAVAVEKDSRSGRQIKINAEYLGISEKIKIITKDAFALSNEFFMNEKFNAMYIDPPYSMGARMTELLDKIVLSGIVDSVCVIGVEGDCVTSWVKKGWNTKSKRFGDTFITIFYNWE